MLRRPKQNDDYNIEDLARDVFGPLARAWDEYVEWLAEAMTYTMDCLSPRDDGSEPAKSEMDPVLLGMSELVRGSEAMMSSGFLDAEAREMIEGVRDFSEGYSVEDIDQMNRGWTAMVEFMRPIHPEIFNR